ncbi:CHAT domain-containing protein [Roseateles asaccharophilus]|uniref:CHAT domain-containing protein n=1 Tax=Roseateles asaccharophilus TaxID=582607 RepID=A0ABU2AFI2_9BURK|nr:CHAT domain-containing protein [Roseateles asaccharophilus]MDR7335977.1 CHAT domain-containing protein [Roseateles asaccharophilus]
MRNWMWAAAGLLAATTALAQVDDEDAGESAMALMPAAEAQALLARPLPADPTARVELLKQQVRAAQSLEQRGRWVELLAELAQLVRQQPGAETWVRQYLSAEFVWGSSGKGLTVADAYATDTSLSPSVRAVAALRQVYALSQARDRAMLDRAWQRAQSLTKQALESRGDSDPTGTLLLQVDRLQVRSEVERWDGRLADATATLREAVRLAQKGVEDARRMGASPRDPALLDVYGWYDGSQGMLTYALVRQGRAPEAVQIGQSNLALWRAGQITDAQGARWSYRLAQAQVASRQYAAALENAQRSDDMLQRAGASPASHARWLARQEQVRSLIGLRRWAEADAFYREFLGSLPADSLARDRASDWRLRALLAAKNGRFDEALETVERIHRFRLRLYGEAHPQTQEAAGVRALVRVLKGDMAGAWSDYQPLFAAMLDSPGGWQDLDLAGARGFALGLAFDEFLREISARAQRGDKLEPAWLDRAMQVADRLQTGSTHRALVDASARVRAATPALRALLEEEQTLRSAAAAKAGAMSGTLNEEDRLRRRNSSDETKAELKALPDAERKKRQKAMADELAAVREQVRQQREQVQAAREALTAQRERVAKAYPAYADLVTPTLPAPAQLQKLLSPGEALLVVHPLENATLAWLLVPGEATRFGASAIGAAGWADKVGQIRTALDLSTGRPPTLPVALLHEVWRELVAPLRPGADIKSLLVAADGALAGMPFAAALTAPEPGAFVARHMAVTQLPSAGALYALRRAASPTPAPKPLFGVGDPLFKSTAKAGRAALGAGATKYDAAWGFSYGDIPPLPETRAELTALAKAVGANAQTDLLLGAAATRDAVLAAPLADRRLVAFATHGLMPGELPGVSKPALALAPGKDAGASPLLELDDVLTLRLNAQAVLLSACNTAAGEQGGAAMSGLVRGFFFAGGRSVLATHWAVETASAAALTSATFSAQAPRAEALRLAQVGMIEGKLGGGRWAHPFYWAGYALFGDPSR